MGFIMPLHIFESFHTTISFFGEKKQDLIVKINMDSNTHKHIERKIIP